MSNKLQEIFSTLQSKLSLAKIYKQNEDYARDVLEAYAMAHDAYIRRDKLELYNERLDFLKNLKTFDEKTNIDLENLLSKVFKEFLKPDYVPPLKHDLYCKHLFCLFAYYACLNRREDLSISHETLFHMEVVSKMLLSEGMARIMHIEDTGEKADKGIVGEKKRDKGRKKRTALMRELSLLILDCTKKDKKKPMATRAIDIYWQLKETDIAKVRDINPKRENELKQAKKFMDENPKIELYETTALKSLIGETGRFLKHKKPCQEKSVCQKSNL